jgi:hypothetical protein
LINPIASLGQGQFAPDQPFEDAVLNGHEGIAGVNQVIKIPSLAGQFGWVQVEPGIARRLRKWIEPESDHDQTKTQGYHGNILAHEILHFNHDQLREQRKRVEIIVGIEVGLEQAANELVRHARQWAGEARQELFQGALLADFDAGNQLRVLGDYDAFLQGMAS